ncbi:hypothetical protein niasHT_026392 [Heterodera trifolii]|uniref:Large ribosomal subunit protein uL10-like insertion domain-containing protein n=1 Tax=Heterodera trifolii TaxID=157864 RepID=A0ABD2KPL7_9BILA
MGKIASSPIRSQQTKSGVNALIFAALSKNAYERNEKHVRECVEQYKPLFVFSTENLRAARLTKVRQHFKQNLWIFFAKKQFEAVALGKSAQDEQANELHKQVVQRYFAEHTEADFAQAEPSSRRTFRCRPVQLPEELHLHGAMEPQLRKLGMPTRLENGTIDLLEEFNVCKTGDQLSADQARILKRSANGWPNSAFVCSLGETKRRDLNRLTEEQNKLMIFVLFFGSYGLGTLARRFAPLLARAPREAGASRPPL